MCEGHVTKTDLEMHFTVNLAFVNYFDDMIDELAIQISRNWTTQEQILPLSLETFEISPNLINALKTLQNLAIQYRNKKNILDKKEQELDKPKENSKFQLFLTSFLVNILIFTTALITLIITLIIIYIVYGQSKLKSFSSKHSYAMNKSS